MKYQELLNALAKWIKFLQKALLGLIIFETILVIIIGIASNKIGSNSNLWLGILIFCSIVYIFLKALKAFFQKEFPGSIINELNALNELEASKKALNRQEHINSYITEVISKLNDQTCSIGSESEINLCDAELQNRLSDLLDPVIQNSNILLGSNDSHKITAGVYLSIYYKSEIKKENLRFEYYDNEENPSLTSKSWKKISDKGIIIVSDTLGVGRLIPKDLQDINVRDIQLEIQTAIRKSFNNAEFVIHNIKDNNSLYTILCSDIPEVCSEYPTGVFFLISEQRTDFPSDLNYLFKIFNRLITNYVKRYNDCVLNNILSKAKKTTIPPENSITNGN